MIGTLLKINGTTITKLKQFKVGRNKLWTDSGRAMNGDLRATFVGVFPKLQLMFTYTTEDEMSTLTSLLDLGNFTVEFWDAKSKSVKSALYYAGDYDTPLYSKIRGLYGEFNVDLIPFKKAT